MRRMPLSRMVLVIVALVLHSASVAAAPPDDRPPLPTTHDELMEALAGKALLFFGGHYDDETVLMPLLVDACRFRGATCHFVFAVDSGVGCYGIGVADPVECARIRLEEVRNSVALAGGTVSFFGWSDLFYAHNSAGLRRNLEKWEESYGGRDALVGRFMAEIEERRPDVVFSFDPRHGATCNPNHRAVSRLALEALERVAEDERPRVYFESFNQVLERMSEEQIAVFERGGFYPWPGQTPSLFYDATRKLPDGRRAIDVHVDSLRAHASQFGEIPADFLPDAPDDLMRIPIVPLESIDPKEDLCDAMALDEYKSVDVVPYLTTRDSKLLVEQATEAGLAVSLTIRQGAAAPWLDIEGPGSLDELLDHAADGRLAFEAAKVQPGEAQREEFERIDGSRLSYVARFPRRNLMLALIIEGEPAAANRLRDQIVYQTDRFAGAPD